MGLRERMRGVFPWIDPILDVLDWKKSVVAAVAAIVVAGWSFVKELSAPIIVTLALTVLVQTLYLLYFPAFLRIIRNGIKIRPNHTIWKHKKQFCLYEAACLLADTTPVPESKMDADSDAWYSVLSEAIRTGELKSLSRLLRASDGTVLPESSTAISAEDLKKFCEARGRKPEFLA